MLARYAFTLVAVALAALLRFALAPVLGEAVPYILFFPTVVLCGWYGGLWPGLLSTALGGLAAWFFFVPPAYSFAFVDTGAPWALVLFLLCGVLISLLAESLHDARRRTEASEARERDAYARDVVERRKGQRELLESRERLRMALEAGRMGAWTEELDGTRHVHWSRELERLFGLQPGEFGGTDDAFFAFVHPDDRESLRAAVNRAVAGRADYEAEYRFTRKDGEQRWMMERGRALCDESGKPLRLAGLAWDVTERKRAEARLKEGARTQAALYAFVARLHRAEALDEVYAAALDAMLEALRCDRASILRFDDEGVMRFVAWRGLSDGYRRAVEGHSPWTQDEKNPQPIPVPGIAAADVEPELRAVIEAEGVRALAFIPLVSGGQLVGKFMTYYDAPHAFDGVEIELCESIARQLALGIERRESEETLRASEERLRLALDAGKMGNWEWNVRTNEVSWSPELEEIHGLTRGAFGRTFAAYRKDIHPDDLPVVERAVGRTLEQGDHHVEYRIVRPDGAVRWVEGRGKVFRDEAGQPARVIGVCTDVTERKRAEAALRDADRHKDEFLAMLSHELRNPLAALTTAAQVLALAPPGDGAALQAREVIARQTGIMTRLIEDLLDVSRVTMGKMTLDRMPLDLGELVRNVVDAWRAADRLGAVQVAVSAASVWVIADRLRIEQIFTNLLDNALKFTPAGKRIDVAVRREAGSALLEVVDEGKGIAPELIDHVFDLFVQGPRNAQDNRGGLGLGLALVKRLAELHGGTVAVASAGIASGASFTVRLPAAAHPPAYVPARTVVAPAGARRILIVDDNDDARTMLEAVLAHEGHHVQGARSGASGLALAADSPPDVALIDIGLPDIDGYEVARRLRAARPPRELALIALTGFGQAEDQRRAFAAGFDAHLTKPVTPDRLSQTIAALH
jgi:PAS domain S-box-containing protein